MARSVSRWKLSRPRRRSSARFALSSAASFSARMRSARIVKYPVTIPPMTTPMNPNTAATAATMTGIHSTRTCSHGPEAPRDVRYRSSMTHDQGALSYAEIPDASIERLYGAIPSGKSYATQADLVAEIDRRRTRVETERMIAAAETTRRLTWAIAAMTLVVAIATTILLLRT